MVVDDGSRVDDRVVGGRKANVPVMHSDIAIKSADALALMIDVVIIVLLSSFSTCSDWLQNADGMIED